MAEFNAVNEEMLKHYIGLQLRIVGLSSEKGKILNFKICTIVGYQMEPTIRLHAKIHQDETVYKIKMDNLISLQERQQKQTNSKDSHLQILRVIEACKEKIHHQIQERQREDIVYRAEKMQEYMKAYLKDFKTEKTLICGDFGDIAEKTSNLMIKQLKKIKPGCMGDGKFKLNELFLKGVCEEQAEFRLLEYSVSGFCVKCQVHYIEGIQ